MRRVLAFLLGASLVLAACSSDPSGDSGGPSSANEVEVEVQVASYDLAVGDDQRVIAGLITSDQELVSFGEVGMEFFYLGTDPSGEVELGEGTSATGKFLPVDVPEGGTPEGPVPGPASAGRGVYATQASFDEAGYWLLQVTADSPDGTTYIGQASFPVQEEHRVPAPGDDALATKNLVIGAPDAPPAAIDSRATSMKDVPDEALHRATIAESLRAGRPMVVVFATPVYCVSRFCGPITDMVAGLERRYGDEADFIHVEIWRNYENQVLNKAAADWLYRDETLTEPWVYFIDAKGKIVARWDNVATPAEIERYLTTI